MEAASKNTVHQMQMQAHLNRGCLLIASSGKKSDLDAPFSTGVGRNSGNVNPGHPNLQIQKSYRLKTF